MKLWAALWVLPLCWGCTHGWEDDPLVRISQSIASSANFSHYWICHAKPSSGLDSADPLVMPVLNFSQIPSFQVTYRMQFPDAVYRVRLVNDESPVPCFFLTPPESSPAVVSGKYCKKPDSSGLGNLTVPHGRTAAACGLNKTYFTDPVSLPLIRQRCANLSSAYASTELCRAWRGQSATYLRGPPTPLRSCHVTASRTLPRTDPWLENILSHLPRGDRLNFQNMTGILCAPVGYVFVCGSQNEAWAYKCLDSWHIGGTCLLGYLVTPFSVQNVSETVQWTSSRTLLARIARDLPAGDGYLVGYPFLPWGVVAAHRQVPRNVSEALGIIARDMATALTGLHTSLGSLAKVVPDDRIALKGMLPEQGGVCLVANTTCCASINSSSEVGTLIAKMGQRATRLQQTGDHQSGTKLDGIRNWFTDLFSRKLKGLQSVLGSILKLCLILLVVVALFVIIMYCVIKNCAKKVKTLKTNREMPLVNL